MIASFEQGCILLILVCVCVFFFWPGNPDLSFGWIWVNAGVDSQEDLNSIQIPCHSNNPPGCFGACLIYAAIGKTF